MTLRARLALGFVTITLLLAVPLAVSLLSLRGAKRAADQLQDQAFAASILVSRMRGASSRLRRLETRVYVSKGDDSVSVDSLRSSTHSLLVEADSLPHYGLDTLKQQLAKPLDDLAHFGEIEIAALADSQLVVAENVSVHQVVPAIDAVDRTLSSGEVRLQNIASERVAAVSDAAYSATQLAGLLLAAALAAAAIVAAWITRTISRPVRDLEHGMHAVAGGDFEHRLEITPERGDEFGRLAESFTSMAQQLAELDKLKAEFVSVASHELKTPINVIMGYLKLLEENLYGPLNERQNEIIAVMQTQADSMARLVQHLLDVSRFEAGAARLEPRPMNLRGFLRQLEATYGVLAMQRKLTFAITASDALPEVVTWDADRIEEVLGNLLSNAFKFTEAGGRVDLVVTALGETVHVEVRDTGVGIAPAQLPHIFDKFFQADNQQRTSARGTGLGLAIAKEIVEAHGGSIAAESTVGAGTKFSIMLPVVATTAVGAPRAADASAESQREEAPHESPDAAEVTA
jgi:signal transduction histidine kinase